MPSHPFAGATQVPGVILAGGRSSRMGGTDKALMLLAGLRLVDHVIARLGPQCAPLAINANGDLSRYAALGLPLLADSVPGHPGPLAGVLAGLDWAAALGAPAIVTVAADTPFLPRDLAARLLAAAGSSGLALAASPDAGGTLRRHPTCGLWPVALREELRAALAGGVRRVGVWAEGQGAEIAAFAAATPDPFFNVNRPEDLALAERLAGGD